MVTAGVLDSAVNEVLPDGGTNMTAYVLIGRAEVRGEGRRPDRVLTPAASGGRA